jgi:aryl-alcohol dehydrogenase-like predicted oxidoreductase
MKTQRLGRHGPEISTVGFGAAEIGTLYRGSGGTTMSDKERLEVIRSALAAGITWIDTAELYGNSEELIGRALNGVRDEVLIATKVGPQPEGTGFRPEQVRAACEASLRRLRTDWIDLYQLHWWPDESAVPIEDTWGAMVELVNEGMVRYIGVSTFDRDLVSRCLAIKHVDSLQTEFSMISLADRDLICWCGEQGIGVVTHGPLGYGLLATAMTTQRFAKQASDLTEEQRASRIRLVKAMEPIANRLGVTTGQLALAWNVRQPGVTSAIAGSLRIEHVRENAAAGDIELDDKTLTELDALVAGVE